MFTYSIRALRNASFTIAMLACVILVASDAFAQPRGGRGRPGMNRGGDEGEKSKYENKIKPYDEVITDTAVTKIGLFRHHGIVDALYY